MEFDKFCLKVCINPAYQVLELFYALNKVGMKALMMSGPIKSQDFYKLLLQTVPEFKGMTSGQLKSNRVPSLTTVISMDNQSPGMFVFYSIFIALFRMIKMKMK
jgi:hypothetical protein